MIVNAVCLREHSEGIKNTVKAFKDCRITDVADYGDGYTIIHAEVPDRPTMELVNVAIDRFYDLVREEQEGTEV